MASEGLQVVHALPGRVRLKVAGIKGNPALARRVQQQLAQVPGIKEAAAQAATGSLLIYYDLAQLCSPDSLERLSGTWKELFPEIEAGDWAAELACLAGNPAPGAGAPAAGAPAAAALSGALQAVNTRVAQLTGGLDLKLLAPLTLIFLGLRRLWVSEKVTFPTWSDYLWFGFSTFVMLNRGLVEGGRGAGGEAQGALTEKGAAEGPG
jgi:hypothetical protein